jgi:hypothetical protein
VMRYLAVLVLAALATARPILDPTIPLISGGNIKHRDSDWQTVKDGDNVVGVVGNG